MKKLLFVFLISLFLAGCESNTSIVNNVEEREANEIVVFLASKGIAAQKVQTTSEAAGGTPTISWDIYVDKSRQVDAMALLNQQGLPRIKGTNLLTLFAKTGLMTSDKEETIRYQAGVEEELKNIIRKIDGVLDADVRISFPSETAGGLGGGPEVTAPKIKAAVYVKHQGILDDPNQHLESKIKRLVSGSIENLSFDDVSVISDKSRFAEIKFPQEAQLIGPKGLEKEYVKIWSIIMTKSSAKKFRLIFFTMIIIIFVFAAASGWLIYKFYPVLKSKKEEKQNK